MLRQSTTCQLSRQAAWKRIGTGYLPTGAGTKVDKEAPPVLDIISGLLAALTGAFGTLTTLIALVLGLLSLFLGRRFFWLFIGLAGFAVGLVLSQGLASGADDAVRPLLVIGLAILFGVLAIVARRIMTALAGAVVLALVAYTLTAGFPVWIQVLATLIGGLIGAALAGWLLDWGLIVGSALLGSLMVSSVLGNWIDSAGMLSFVLFAALALAGIFYQARDLTRG
jgi:hypothetical protein